MTAIYRSGKDFRAVRDGQRAFLQQWPVPSTEMTVPTRHGETFVVASGPEAASPLILLHGAGFNSVAWIGDVSTWAHRHRVCAIDVIGEPGRSAPSRPALNSDAYAEWLDDVWDELGIADAAVVGTSLGGWLAVDYAVRRPDRVARLALLSTGGIGWQKYAAIVASLFLLPFGERGRRAAVALVIGPADGQDMSDAMADYALLIQRSYRPRRDRLPIFTDEQLARLAIPVMVVAGARDRMLDQPGTVARLRKLVPDTVIELRPRAGHIPTDYTETVARFLNQGRPS